MADLFDIANIITSVGVGAVKIKSEPGLPEKSSNEILTELFSTFDADEGIVSPENSDQQVPDAIVKAEKKEKTQMEKRKKKSKKKHKHKEKKHKKRSKHTSSDSNNSDIESTVSKKKKKHRKKSKRKHESHSSKSSESDEPKSKIAKVDTNVSLTEEQNIGVDVSDKERVDDVQSREIASIKEETKSTNVCTIHAKEDRDLGSPKLPPIPKKIDDEFEESVLPKILDKPKQPVQGKIIIKDLKNSIVYNETVKEIENKEKAKAARMEDGELTDSSNNNRTPTLSPTPPPCNSFRSPTLSPDDTLKSESTGPLKSKNDLRLILREKEKKRLEVTGKSRNYGDKDRKDTKVYNKVKNKNCKRSRSCHSQERNRSDSQTRSHRSRSRDREKHSDKSKERRDRDRSFERRELGRSRERKRHKSRSRDRSRDKYTRGRSRSKERKERIEIDKKKLLDELTDFCKSLSKSEALGELSNLSSEEDGSESEKGFHHPFLLKERPSPIVMNIRNAKQLPTKTFQEKTAESSNQLRLQFPVSSGQHHRKTESEWIPVTPKKPEQKKPFVPASMPTEPISIVPKPCPVQPVQSIQPVVFPRTSMPVDIGSIVSQRLAAMRKLRENPNDVGALNEMYRAQNEMRTWAESKQMPGQFTGSTGAKVLSPAELTSGYQAWAHKDQLVSAQPVSGGMGMALLQKMGWRPGEGLGKNKEGTLEPLQLEVKLDKRGLISEQDIGQKTNKTAKPIVPAIKTLEGKHPVSLLGEYCSKRKLGAPVYELCFECGPDHRKNFLFKVKVNGIEYKPSVASPNKKQAKAEAAQICLQTLGLLSS
ncbi:protein Son isoform X2 [Vespula pensylvanica]|uniref:protein Son isoform X2 n=1 Tax=Vespula pensylvanica TaxID=30213 RepID=UPI001CBA276F|nr:protein Son isoform X2 [Vespula pensylvanica]